MERTDDGPKWNFATRRKTNGRLRDESNRMTLVYDGRILDLEHEFQQPNRYMLF